MGHEDQPGVKHQQYLWHLMVPVSAYGDQTDVDVDVAERLTTLATNCIENIVIEGDGLPGKVVCDKMTVSTLQPLGDDGDRATGPEGLIADLVPIVANPAREKNERIRAVVTLAAVFGAYDLLGGGKNREPEETEKAISTVPAAIGSG